MPKVLIVDDFAIVRAGVIEMLQHLPEIEFFEAGSAADARTRIKEKDWDLIILDINLPDNNGVELLNAVKSEKPDSKVLILSMQKTDRYALLMMRSGAHGYLDKESLSGELVTAVNTILSGRKYVNTDVATVLLQDVEKQPAALHLALSGREREIFDRLCRGVRVTDAATELGLSVKTVSTYKRRVLEKMNMKSEQDLIYYGIKENLVAPDELQHQTRNH